MDSTQKQTKRCRRHRSSSEPKKRGKEKKREALPVIRFLKLLASTRIQSVHVHCTELVENSPAPCAGRCSDDRVDASSCAERAGGEGPRCRFVSTFQDASSASLLQLHDRGNCNPTHKSKPRFLAECPNPRCEAV